MPLYPILNKEKDAIHMYGAKERLIYFIVILLTIVFIILFSVFNIEQRIRKDGKLN